MDLGQSYTLKLLLRKHFKTYAQTELLYCVKTIQC